MSLSNEKKLIVFIIHGKINRKKRLEEQLLSAFPRKSYQIKLLWTQFKGHAISLASKSVDDGFNHIISVGGDGTLNEAINGVLSNSRIDFEQSQNELRVGILPYGAGNDFARGVGITKSLVALEQAIKMDLWTATDIGKMEFNGIQGQRETRYFINIADIGIGGVIAQKLSRMSKWAGATITYQLVILSTLWSYKHQNVIIRSKEYSYDGAIMGVIMANGRYFGSGLGIAPGAKINDGVLNLVHIGPISVLDYLLQIPKLKKCALIQHPQLSYHTLKELKIEHQESPLPIDMDGEFVGFTPLHLKVIPRAIKIWMPRV